MRKLALLGAAVGLVLAVVLFVLAGQSSTEAADHLDAPDLSPPAGNLMADLADLFVFPPGGGAQVTIAVTSNPAAGVFGPVGFDPSVDYTILVDNDGDALADIELTFRFDAPGANERQSYTVTRDGKTVASGNTGSSTKFDGGGRVFAGLVDDPFFFDLDAFLGSGGRSFCDGGETDFFAGLNVNAVVLQVPASDLGDGAIGVWATTSSGGTRIDRTAFPAINTVFIPSNKKNRYNAGNPVDDPATFSRFLRRAFKAGGNTTPTAVALTGVLLPDIMPFDPAAAGGFLNGRQLADDVIDAELGLLTAGALPGDCVDANDVPFLAKFPYLAAAH